MLFLKREDESSIGPRDDLVSSLWWCALPGIDWALRGPELLYARRRANFTNAKAYASGLIRPWKGGYRAGGTLFLWNTSNQARVLEPLATQLQDETRHSSPVGHGHRPAPRTLHRYLSAANRALEDVEQIGVRPNSFRYELAKGRLLAAGKGAIRAGRIFDFTGLRRLVVASQHDPAIRGALLEARNRGIPTIYTPHAPVARNRQYADLPVSRALLRGIAELDVYANWGADLSRVSVVGDPGLDGTLAPVPANKVVILALSQRPDDQLLRMIETLHRARQSGVTVAPHPRNNLKRISRMVPGTWSLASERTWDLLGRGASCLIQSSSGVALQGLLRGIPTVDLQIDGATPSYAFISEPHVRLVQDEKGLAKALGDYASEPTRQALTFRKAWAKKWCQAIGKVAIDQAVALIEQTQIRPGDDFVLDGWKDVPPAQVLSWDSPPS